MEDAEEVCRGPWGRKDDRRRGVLVGRIVDVEFRVEDGVEDPVDAGTDVVAEAAESPDPEPAALYDVDADADVDVDVEGRWP